MLVGFQSLLLLRAPASPAPGEEDVWLSPCALAASKDGRTLFVACATAHRVLRVDLATHKVSLLVKTPASPSGLVLGLDDSNLFITCAGPESTVGIVDPTQGAMVAQIPVGHTAMAPVLSPDGRVLMVCNRFNNNVSLIDLATRRELCRIPVQREPVAAAVTPDGKLLLVANFLPKGPATAKSVAAVVSVIDLPARKVVKELQLPDGSGSLNDLRITPDGKYALVTHIRSRFRLPATLLERGWMNTNAQTLIDLSTLEILNTVLLDEPREGAANPWGVSWSADGACCVVAHAGTHEISLLDFPRMLAKLRSLPPTLDEPRPTDYGPAARVQTEVPNDLSFLTGIRRRVKLPDGDLGPRAVLMVGTRVFTANYFSDTLSVIDTAGAQPKVETIALAPRRELPPNRKGEFYFHDASICLQHWQSCSSCHPGGGRADALNWDLPNDGIRTPKNTKSLLLAHETPPAMSLGVRDSAETAVRAGIEHVLFAHLAEEVPAAMDEYLKSLKPVPSPFLDHGRLSPSARRGREVFGQAGCSRCHRPGLFTDLHSYDVGTRGRFDQAGDKFDTPTLVELWRTSPYLHDGSAATAREVVTAHTSDDRHGKISRLTSDQIDDLCAYLLSL